MPRDEAKRQREWEFLHDRITETLDRYGKKDACGRGDYWLVDEDLGQYRLQLEVQNLNLLQPSIIKSLRRLLAGYPAWEIMFRVDVLGKENEWPAMGLVIQDDGIIDDLKREFLPEEFRYFVYEGAKSSKKTLPNENFLLRRALK